jgi:hypothetical protein
LGYRSISLYSYSDGTFIRYPDKDGPAFKLLEVCTQIYFEAVILPYSLNVFCFPTTAIFQYLSHGMSASSIQAIETLELSLSSVLYDVDSFTSLIVRFKGLKHIRLNYDVRLPHLERCGGDELRDLAEAFRNTIPGVKVLAYNYRVGRGSEIYY